MSERDDRPDHCEDDLVDDARVIGGQVSDTDGEVSDAENGDVENAPEGDASAIITDGKDKPRRTDAERDEVIRNAFAGLSMKSGVEEVLSKAIGADKLFNVLMPKNVFDRSLFSEIAQKSAALVPPVNPALQRMADLDFDAAVPPTADQLAELNDRAETQAVHLKSILEVMVESVAISREATEAAKATAAQARESQRTAENSARAAWASVWLVIGFSALQLIIAVIELGKS